MRSVTMALLLVWAFLTPVDAMSDDAAPAGAYGYAFGWYERAARAGDPKAQYFLGMQYERGVRGEGPDMAAAVRWYRKSAEGRWTAASFRLGWLYAEGKGVSRDMTQAAKWFGQAAEGGLPEAQYNLALLHETGSGVEKDLGKAAAWYEKAAQADWKQAQRNLGLLLARGAGVGQDRVKALAWLILAASGDGAIAIGDSVLASVREGMSAEDIAKAGELAKAWRSH